MYGISRPGVVFHEKDLTEIYPESQQSFLCDYEKSNTLKAERRTEQSTIWT